MIARQGMGQSTRTPTLSQVRAVSTQREPTGRVIIVIVAEREERREERRERRKRREERREERRRETRRDGDEKRQKERQTEGQTEHERREGGKPSVCRFKTLPCVRSGRLRVYPANARMFNTCGRFPGSHGGGLNARTEAS